MNTPQCVIALSANAGISLTLGMRRVWIDALHTGAGPFSKITAEVRAKMLTDPAFAEPDAICFSHCHPDHYSHEMTMKMAPRWPKAKLILPRMDFDRQITLSGAEQTEHVGGMTFRFLKTRHAGGERLAVPLYSILVTDGTTRILIPGDCAVGDPELLKLTGGLPVDVAVLNFPWITRRDGRAFLREQIQAGHLLVYHLPFEEDDRYGYRAATEAEAEKMRSLTDVRILARPMQTEILY